MPSIMLVHWIYLVVTFTVIFFMVRKKDVIVPCIVGTFMIGLVHSGGDLVFGLQGIFRSMTVVGQNLFEIILIIAIMTAMLKALEALGADQMMILPVAKFIKSPSMAFWIIAGVMYLASLFFWPTPATALVGTILIPIAIKAGLKPILSCVALNIAGHGMALSGDLIIQGAPGLTATSANLPVENVILYGGLFSIITGIVSLLCAYFLNYKDIFNVKKQAQTIISSDMPKLAAKPVAKFFALGVPLVFVVVITRIVVGNTASFGLSSIVGGSATALLGGSAALILILSSYAQGGWKSPGALIQHLRQGFVFSMKVFSPIIPIAGFFMLGAPGPAAQILGEGAHPLLFDISNAISMVLPFGTVPVTVGLVIISGITGLDGSGFSGLPLIGSLASSLAEPAGLNPAILAGLGQTVGVFVGGGTLSAWAFGIVAAAGSAGVSATELVRKNFAPVLIGIGVSTTIAIILQHI